MAQIFYQVQIDNFGKIQLLVLTKKRDSATEKAHCILNLFLNESFYYKE